MAEKIENLNLLVLVQPAHKKNRKPALSFMQDAWRRLKKIN